MSTAPEEFTSWFAGFYREQFGAVVAFLVRMGAKTQEAEDSVQSAMESFLVHRDVVRDGPAWVRVVARNNWLRAMRQKTVPLPPETIEATAPGEGANPARIAHQRIEQRNATELVRQLPPRQREIVALIADGYDAAEIASLLGSSPAVIRSNLAHARRRLKRVHIRFAA
jgi:RNA polymerase sigma factor (sigma-70 family)